MKNSFISTLLISFLFFATNLSSEEESYDFKEFNETLSLTRGTVSPAYTESYYLENNDACRFAKNYWGWEDENCPAIDSFLVNTSPDIDTIVIEVASSDGYVKYDDWESNDRDQYIQELWEGLNETYAVQGKNLNVNFKVVRWLVSPTFNKEKNYIYYAYLLDQDGTKSVQLAASILDRKGYIKFLVIPINLTSSSLDGEFKETIESALNLYTPNQSNSHADYTIGDKVSDYGIFGVFAALSGIKWGKAVASGILATFLIFAKKLWWVILLPLYTLVRRFFKKSNNDR
mgnify:CR=1 FL=1